jgi:GNAT superfamily N-acetyltransferase
MTKNENGTKIKLSDDSCQKIFGESRKELSAQVERHTLMVQAWLSSRSPQAMTLELHGTRLLSTGLKIPLLNLAIGCNFPANATESEVEEEIETVKKFFSNRHVPWYWWMNTSPSPRNIQNILKARGIEYDAPPLPAMAASLSIMDDLPKYPEQIRVWQAESTADLRAASTIRRIAFRFPEGEAAAYFEDMASDWLENPNVKLFLAGETLSNPISIGAMIMGAEIPGVYVMATLPEQHRKGYGKAMLARLMNEAAKSGHSIMALTASNAGYSLYSQFGFQHIFDFDFYSPTR